MESQYLQRSHKIEVTANLCIIVFPPRSPLFLNDTQNDFNAKGAHSFLSES